MIPDLNVRQFYRLTRVDGPRRTGTVIELSGRLPVPPPNGAIDAQLGTIGGGIQQPAGNIRVFAGQRDEGFYVDLAIFDLLGVGSGQIETAPPANVSSLAIQVPKSALARGGDDQCQRSAASSAVTASRFATRAGAWRADA